MPFSSRFTIFALIFTTSVFINGCNRYTLRESPFLLSDLPESVLKKKIKSDMEILIIIDRKMDQLTTCSRNYFEPLRNENPSILTRTQRKELREIWAQYLDMSVVLQKFVVEYGCFDDFTQIEQVDACLISYGAYLLLYSSGITIIENTAHIAPFEILLNEPIPEYSIIRGQYTHLKWQVVHIEEFYPFEEGYLKYKNIMKKYSDTFANDNRQYLSNLIELKYTLCKQKLQSETVSNSIKNILDTFKHKSFDVLFPIQKNFALFMGLTRFTPRTDGFISDRQCKKFIQKAQPGDILLERKEWYLSNLGIPGFWSHSAFYIGSPKELKSWSNAPEILEFYRAKDPACTGFVNYLERRYPEAYSAYLAGEKGEENRIIEGLKEGIVFHSVSGSVGISDHAACLRPRLTKIDIIQAIEIAFQYWGREYDYTFNLLSDHELICSELIYKCYEPAPGKNGLAFELSNIMGTITLPVNRIVAQFDREYDINSQFDFVLYYSGNIITGKASSKNLNAFRKSHKLPHRDLHIVENIKKQWRRAPTKSAS